MSDRTGLRTVGLAVGAVVAVAAALLTVLVAGMRWKLPPVLDAVRRMNRSVTNPRVMRSAGSKEAPTAVIRHVGRTSGRAYETPVDVIVTEDGFLIALPYGTRADWVRNVMSAGSATIAHRGQDIAVRAPSIIATSDVAHQLPGRTLRTLRLFGVTECLHVRKAADGPG